MTSKEPLEIHKTPTTKPANNQQPTIGDQQLANKAPLEIQTTHTNHPAQNQTNNHWRSRLDKQRTVGDPHTKTTTKLTNNQQATIGDQPLANEAP